MSLIKKSSKLPHYKISHKTHMFLEILPLKFMYLQGLSCQVATLSSSPSSHRQSHRLGPFAHLLARPHRRPCVCAALGCSRPNIVTVTRAPNKLSVHRRAVQPIQRHYLWIEATWGRGRVALTSTRWPSRSAVRALIVVLFFSSMACSLDV